MLLRKDHPVQTSSALSRAAFTLMEMMVVVAIIIILIGISVPLVINYWNNSKIDATKARLRTVLTAVQTYEMNNNTQVQDLTVLLQQDPAGRQPTIRQQELIDSWNQPIVLEGRDPNNGTPILMSQGMPGANRPLRSNDP